jgi:hypothetical protein
MERKKKGREGGKQGGNNNEPWPAKQKPLGFKMLKFFTKSCVLQYEPVLAFIAHLD